MPKYSHHVAIGAAELCLGFGKWSAHVVIARMITAIARTTPKLNANPDSCGIPAGAINAVLAAAGYNFRRLLAWLRVLLLRILIAQQAGPNPPEIEFFTDDYLLERLPSVVPAH